MYKGLLPSQSSSVSGGTSILSDSLWWWMCGAGREVVQPGPCSLWRPQEELVPRAQDSMKYIQQIHFICSGESREKQKEMVGLELAMVDAKI